MFTAVDFVVELSATICQNLNRKFILKVIMSEDRPTERTESQVTVNILICGVNVTN